MTDLRYPIGKFQRAETITDAMRNDCIKNIEEAPMRLREIVAGLNDEQLNTAYRPDGWTVRQVVHHMVDSHVNGYVRSKLAITEDEPTIKPYQEERWAELPEARNAPIEMSLMILEGLHRRWAIYLRSLAPADFARRYRHPENGLMNLDALIQTYSWHSRHHVAHIVELRKRMGWK